MRSSWKPILALLLTAPFLTELLSGNLPPSVFFQPQVYLFLATIAYGFPILLLREFALRRHIGLAGWFLLGLIYGIFNEGILAKTFYLETNVPIKNFDGYGYDFGIAIPWAILISIWHALHAFIYPLVAVGCFFPQQRNLPWLGKRVIPLIAIPTLTLGVLIFVSQTKDRSAGDRGHFILMMGLICLLLWLATKLGPRPTLEHPEKLRMPFLFLGGLAPLALLLVPLLLASAKVPVSVFCGYNLLLVFWMLWLIRRRATLAVNNVLLFGMGDDSMLALIGLVTAIGSGSGQRIAANALFLILFAWLWLRLRKSSDG